MSNRRRVKLVREGQYVAEVDVELIEDDTGWSPYLSPMTFGMPCGAETSKRRPTWHAFLNYDKSRRNDV